MMQPTCLSIFRQHRNGRLGVCIATGFTAAMAATAAAQSPSAELDDTLVVSATRLPNYWEEVGSSVSVILAADIETRQYAFAADALRDAVGVTIARNGSFGGVASARIRGASSGQSLIVIDGIVVNDPSAPQGGFNFANLGVADIARIEILRGPQSLLYGADAIGGVIAITTKRNAPGTRAYLEGGARGTVRGGASATLGRERAYARFTVSGARTDGISRAASGAEADAFRTIAGSLTGGFALNNHWKAELIARYSDSHAEIDGFPPPFFSLADTDETEKTNDHAVAGRMLHDHDRFSGALTISYNAIDRTNRDLGVETFSAEGNRLSADYIGAINLTANARLIAGADAERSTVFVSGIDESAKAGAIFVLAEIKPLAGLTLSAGVRRDEFSNFDGATTARAAAAWAAPGGWVLRASWGQGFRAPTLFELNLDQFGVIPNPDLRPERANGFDIGGEKRFSHSGSEFSAILRASIFQTRVKDQIDFDFAGSGFFNIDRTRARGVELESELHFGERLSVNLAYSHVDAIDRETRFQQLRQPKHSGTAIISLAPTGQLSVSTSLTFNSRENDVPAPNNGFIRADMRAAYALTERLEIYGRIENLTNTDYQDVSGFGEPGASAFGGVRVRL